MHGDGTGWDYDGSWPPRASDQWLPDLTDAATGGVLLEMVEALGEPLGVVCACALLALWGDE